MSISSAEDIYDLHIKALPTEQQLRLVEIVLRELADQTPQKEQRTHRNLMDLHGLGKEIWEGVDAQAYVDQLRSEWDMRP